MTTLPFKDPFNEDGDWCLKSVKATRVDPGDQIRDVSGGVIFVLLHRLGRICN